MTEPTIAPDQHLFTTFARVDLAFERGEGAWLYTTSGERYLDFMAGIAVNSLGHAHPALVAAITAQAEKLWHVSNAFQVPGQQRLADKLCALTFADRVFFCNSGAEALEGAIKTARRYFYAKGETERNRIITFDGAFHGRTLATLSAAGNKKYLEGFDTSVDGFDHAPFGDLNAVKAMITPQTAAILIEPVQGEGGVRPAEPQFLRALRQLCDDHGLLLIFDEVQAGIGRTGTFLACEISGVTPDIAALAKGLGGGFPVGAILATEDAANVMTPGTHGTTFGGNPLAMAVGEAVVDVIGQPDFLDHVKQIAGLLRQGLASVVDHYPDIIAGVRGEGLLLGLQSVIPNGDLVAALRNEHLLTIGASDNVVRLLPPLIIGETEVSEAVSRIDRACAALRAARQATTPAAEVAAQREPA